MDLKLHYSDVFLQPRYSYLKSRSEANTSVNFLGKDFACPIVAANMKCAIDKEKAKWFSQNDLFYVMHRFDIDILKFVEKANVENWPTISISIGVGEKDMSLMAQIVALGLRVDYVTIDIAHGHSCLMVDMLGYLKSFLKVSSKVIAGNVASVEGYKMLVDYGADAVKVGIGGGSVCSTKNKTGFTFPMYSCVSEIAKQKTAPVIADGGIKENGDIAKAIHAGADMVMAGGVFARLVNSPAESQNGHKEYFGSASEHNKGFHAHVEGVKKHLPIENKTYAHKIKEIQEDLRSSISYAGGSTLADIRRAEVFSLTSWER